MAFTEVLGAVKTGVNALKEINNLDLNFSSIASKSEETPSSPWDHMFDQEPGTVGSITAQPTAGTVGFIPSRQAVIDMYAELMSRGERVTEFLGSSASEPYYAVADELQSAWGNNPERLSDIMTSANRLLTTGQR